MPAFELANIRRELLAAIVALEDEPLGTQSGDTPSRSVAVDHVRTALLMLTGSTTADIYQHPVGSVHTDTPS